jgi:hypothetical protein
VDGTLAVGPAFAGEIGALELEALPLAALWPGASFGGRLDASLDVQAAEGRPVGSLTLRARQGSATLPQLPMPLAFESLEARIALGTDSALVQVEELTLAGPGLVARVTGSLGHASSFVEAPLDLGIELEVDAALRAPLQGLGVRLRPDGRGRLRVTGTGANPQVE